MKITNLTTAVMESNFDWTIVKIETDEKITGYGEAFLGPGLTSVIREFAPILLGEDPTNFDRLLRRLRATVVYSSPGLVFHAICGIEAAILDIVGRKHKMPVWQILGGKFRDSVRVYADCHAGEALESITPLLVPRTPAWMSGVEAPQEKAIVSLKHHGWDAAKHDHLKPDSYATRAGEMAARGFTMLKFDVDVPTPYETDEYNRDLGRQEVEYAAALVGAVRKAVGPSVELAIDCHWNYGVQAAIELARAVEPHKLQWFEDPVPPENIRALADVQRNTATPVTTGENHYFWVDFQRLIVEGGLRILVPDVQKLGMWEGRRIADMADRHYVNVAWHNISGPLGTMAGVHLAASMPNLTALEWHAASVPFFDQLVKNAAQPMIRNGRIEVPDAPGIGIELDEDVMHKYRKPGERFFE